MHAAYDPQKILPKWFEAYGRGKKRAEMEPNIAMMVIIRKGKAKRISFCSNSRPRVSNPTIRGSLGLQWVSIRFEGCEGEGVGVGDVA